MTLADSRPAVTATVPAAVPVATSSVDSATLSQGQLEMMRAFFCYEFEVAQLDRSSVPEASAEVVAEWIEALEMSGLFGPRELATMTDAWLAEPEALIALLVGDVDEVAARRDGVPTVDTVAAVSTLEADYLRAS